MTSDRLVTLQRAGKYDGDHNAYANKNIILRTADAILLLGFSGPAYIEDVPTDDWIASVLLLEKIDPNIVMTLTRKRWKRVSSAIHALVVRLKAAGQLDAIQLLLVGYRQTRRGLYPFNIRIKDGRIQGNMRRPQSYQFRAIGQRTLHAELLQYVVQPSSDLYSGNADPAVVFKQLTNLVRSVSAREPTVGADLMELYLPGHAPTEVHIAYRSRDLMTSFYSPWIISIGVYPPAQTTPHRGGVGGDAWMRIVTEGSDEIAADHYLATPAPRVPPPGPRVKPNALQ